MQDFNNGGEQSKLKKQEQRICPYSGLKFTPKRSNQIYANAEYRIAHNNEKNRLKQKPTKKAFNLLHKNYNILHELMEGKKIIKVHSEFLRGAGFSFSVFTHFEEDLINGVDIYALHDFTFYKYEGDIYTIRRNERY